MTAHELKAWRTERKLTQRELAGLLGMPLKTYQRWEQGSATPAYLPLALKGLGINPVKRT
jgi:transcriptional regulator with XRE-family HTH domain